MEAIYKHNKSWIRVLKIIVPYLLITGIFQYVGMLIAGLDVNKLRSADHATPSQDFVVCFFTLAGTALTVWLFRKYVDKASFISLGFGKTGFKTDVLKGLALGFGIMFLSWLLLLGLHQITFVNIRFRFSDMAFSMSFYIFVAFTEELLMRGYVLNNLLKSFNKYVALFITSIIFSLMHGSNPNINLFALFELFLAGVLLGLAYIYTKSLWFAVALHFSWNFFQGTIFGFNVSGMEKYNLISTIRHSNNLWNGGVFGYEGSLTSVFFQLAAIGLVYAIFNKQEAGFADDELIHEKT